MSRDSALNAAIGASDLPADAKSSLLRLFAAMALSEDDPYAVLPEGATFEESRDRWHASAWRVAVKRYDELLNVVGASEVSRG